jgi:2-oxoglutarate ferredoxin oxidoreductase subunit alpha
MRPVLAPTTVADTFPVTVEAFNIAEEYQTPVILLSDQEIAQRKETVDPIDTSARVIERLGPTASSSPTTRASASPSRASAPSATRDEGRQLPRAGIEHNEHGATPRRAAPCTRR